MPIKTVRALFVTPIELERRAGIDGVEARPDLQHFSTFESPVTNLCTTSYLGKA